MCSGWSIFIISTPSRNTNNIKSHYLRTFQNYKDWVIFLNHMQRLQLFWHTFSSLWNTKTNVILLLLKHFQDAKAKTNNFMLSCVLGSQDILFLYASVSHIKWKKKQQIDVQLDVQYNLLIKDIEVWFQQTQYAYNLLHSGTFIQYNLMITVSVENFLSLSKKVGGKNFLVCKLSGMSWENL